MNHCEIRQFRYIVLLLLTCLPHLTYKDIDEKKTSVITSTKLKEALSMFAQLFTS